MKHPLQKFPKRSARWIVLALLLGLNAWLGVKAGADGALVNKEARYGIVSLELAGTPPRARKVVESWNQRTLQKAGEPRRSIYYDFAYLLAYSNLLALCCVMSAEALGPRRPALGRIGLTLAWSQYGAALFDAIENVSLLIMVREDAAAPLTHSSITSPLPEIAFAFASLKFIIIVAGVFYILAGALSSVVLREKL
jgi:hypothetical protein